MRRYAANPGPARRSTLHAPAGRSRTRPLAPAAEVFPAEDVALVRPYYTAHERSRADDGDRAQADACARLARWTKQTPEAPAPPAPVRIPVPRAMPAGDLLAPAPGPRVPPDLADLERAVRVWVSRQDRRRQEAGVG